MPTHYQADEHAGALCGRTGPMTRVLQKVKCVYCLQAIRGMPDPLKPVPVLPTVGESAIRELHELRERIKTLADDWETLDHRGGPNELRRLLES